MGRQDNLLEKIKQRPTAIDISSGELQSFMSHFGFECVRINGSHFIYKYKGKGKSFAIPMHNPIKPSYIDLIRDIILEIEDNEQL